MEKKQFWMALRELIQNSYQTDGKGLNMMQELDNSFANSVDKPYRLKDLKENGHFQMTPNERFFHTIGFLDALNWLHKNGYINYEEVDYDLSDDNVLLQMEERIANRDADTPVSAIMEDLGLSESYDGDEDFKHMVENAKSEANLLYRVFDWFTTGNINAEEEI